jgi:hypothetical protein
MLYDIRLIANIHECCDELCYAVYKRMIVIVIMKVVVMLILKVMVFGVGDGDDNGDGDSDSKGRTDARYAACQSVAPTPPSLSAFLQPSPDLPGVL